MRLHASFRDPSGFLFKTDGILYRQVNPVYKEDYDCLLQSGLYDALIGAGMLILHREVSVDRSPDGTAYKILSPQELNFISYPYEWSFSQFKAAAILTLEIHQKAMDYGMGIKDGSAYNIQFLNGRPILIDTLSFEKYQNGKPWVAYRQFCQHFLGPLAVMAYTDIRLQQFLRIYIDGLPLDLACRFLPWYARLNPLLLMHLYLHSGSQKKYQGRQIELRKFTISKTAHLGIIDSLRSAIKALKYGFGKTEWGDYYSDTNYSEASFESKKTLVRKYIDSIKPEIVWDLGANNGTFSRIAAETAGAVMAFDIDPVAVEKLFIDNTIEQEKHYAVTHGFD